jgi:hypothetical protein
MKKLIIAVLLMFMLAGCDAAKDERNEDLPPQNDDISASQSEGTPITQDATGPGQVTVSFDYESQSGHASNQFAVWIEDADGNMVNTLYATKYTAGGGYERRPDSIRNWVEKSGLADMTAAQADAVSGATPKSGKLSYVWDLTDGNGNAVPDGKYAFVVEGTMRWKNYVLSRGDIEVGGDSVTATAEPTYHFEGDGDNAALTEDSAETNMIANVVAEYAPAG